MTFEFGDLTLDPGRRELRSAGGVVAMEPQAFDVLVHLVLHRDRVVPKEELMDTIWGGRFVTEAAVTSRIKQVRRAVGDDGNVQTHVRTYHGRGYRFVADVRLGADAAPDLPSAPVAHATPEDRERAASSPVLRAPLDDGESVGFQLTGQGPPDLLLWPPVPDLAGEWDDDRRADLLVALGGLGRLVRLEGAGRDDPAAVVPPVLDAAASERVVLVADGGPALDVLGLAAAHPARTSAVLLLGCSLDEADPAPPDLGATPVLVLHRRDDPVVPVAHGRRLAALLPQAEFVALPGDRHEPEAHVDQVVDAARDLLEDLAAQEAAGRSLTSLVGLAGDDLESLTEVLVGLGGRERRGPEDAVIVSFDGPAGAFRALASRRARGLVDEVGVGVAIDDVARDAYLISGHGVDVARLFAGLASPGEVLFPNVIKHLLASSGLSSEPLPVVDLPHVGPHPVHRWQRR